MGKVAVTLLIEIWCWLNAELDLTAYQLQLRRLMLLNLPAWLSSTYVFMGALFFSNVTQCKWEIGFGHFRGNVISSPSKVDVSTLED